VSPRFAATAKQDQSKLQRRCPFAFLGNGHNLQILSFYVRPVVSTDVFEHFARFFVTASRSQISGAVWEELDASEKQKRRETLERKQKTPADLRVSVVDEGKSEREPVSHRDSEIVGDENVAQESTTMLYRRC